MSACMHAWMWYRVLWEQGAFGELSSGWYVMSGSSLGKAGEVVLQAEGVSGHMLGHVGSRGSGGRGKEGSSRR